MKVLYFDNNGKYSELETEGPKRIEIPLLVRYNSSTDNFVCQLGEDGSVYRDMANKKRKLATQYTFYDMKLVHRLDTPTNMTESWEVEGVPDLGDANYILTVKLQEFVDWFVRCFCMRLGYEQRERYSWMGETYYYHDVILDKMYNTKVHLLGDGHIFCKNIRNCLVFIHGNYELHVR